MFTKFTVVALNTISLSLPVLDVNLARLVFWFFNFVYLQLIRRCRSHCWAQPAVLNLIYSFFVVSPAIWEVICNSQPLCFPNSKCVEPQAPHLCLQVLKTARSTVSMLHSTCRRCEFGGTHNLATLNPNVDPRYSRLPPCQGIRFLAFFHFPEYPCTSTEVLISRQSCGITKHGHCWVTVSDTSTKKIMARVGIEPTTFALLARRSNQLS